MRIGCSGSIDMRKRVQDMPLLISFIVSITDRYIDRDREIKSHRERGVKTATMIM